MISESNVLIRNGLIAFVGSGAGLPEAALEIDGTGMTLIPGLIDSHVHVFDRSALRQSLYFGVTTVIDMFMEAKTMQRLKQEQSSGRESDRAFLVSPGTLVTAPGGHGTQFGLKIPTLSRPEEAEQFVLDRIEEGSDFIKIIYDDGKSYGLNRPTLDKETIAAVIQAAHKHGKKAVVHAATLENCKTVMQSGADGLAHLFFNDDSDPGFGRTAKECGIFVIPTFSVLAAMSGIEPPPPDPMLVSWLKPMDVVGLKQGFPFQSGESSYRAAENAFKQLKEEGVPILAGTDAPNPGTVFGASLHLELELLVHAGLSPLEALRAATSVPADIFGLENRGRIKPEAAADLVLVKGDPSFDIKITRDIALIWKNGTLIDRGGYQKEIENAFAEQAKLKSAPPPEYSESGWISDFEGEKIDSRFGVGWIISTDAMMGGKSTANYSLVPGGALGSKKSLEISGVVNAGSAITWAGAMFSPGKAMMSPANLSFMSGISFWAKGPKGNYTILLYSRSLGFTPSMQAFQLDPEWKEYHFSFESFGIEGYDIMGIFIGASGTLGEFAFQIDNVRLK